MIKTVILIGTSHKYQQPIFSNIHGVEEFQAYIVDLCQLYKIKSIAEEMSIELIEEKGFQLSGLHQICNSMGISHQYSDPSRKERLELNIRPDTELDIKLKNITKIEANIIEAVNNGKREKEWLRRILVLDCPLIFVCGANHFLSFSSQLKTHGVTVIESDRDWEYNP
ncbi:MAG: hypothetical protein RLZ92_1687 [Pseudomonadota bacterium]